MMQVLISATTYQRICGRLDELRLPALQKAYALPQHTTNLTRRMHHRRPAGLWSSFQMAMSMTRGSASCSISGPSSQSHGSRDLVGSLQGSMMPFCSAQQCITATKRGHSNQSITVHFDNPVECLISNPIPQPCLEEGVVSVVDTVKTAKGEPRHESIASEMAGAFVENATNNIPRSG